jgi:hypothetical protein
MPFTINEFRNSALAKGGARANLFEVEIAGGAATTNLGGAVKEFTFACKAAAIPAMAVGVVEVPYFGRVVKVPGNKTFENWNVTIINDENFDIRAGMEEWMASMSSHLGNLNTATNENLYGTGVVKQYPKTGATAGTIAEYKFEKIFPVNISEIALDWSSNDAIEEFTVEFAYDYWTHSGVALG